MSMSQKKIEQNIIWQGLTNPNSGDFKPFPTVGSDRRCGRVGMGLFGWLWKLL